MNSRGDSGVSMTNTSMASGEWRVMSRSVWLDALIVCLPLGTRAGAEWWLGQAGGVGSAEGAVEQRRQSLLRCGLLQCRLQLRRDSAEAGTDQVAHCLA